ncbi:phosphate uptake regulator PhoU, partial [Candidatus Bathyarchaeota archaeon]|nr:phosphate uptake regulator PhoU [Candidatus Bathyarchaeota archaeon]
MPETRKIQEIGKSLYVSLPRDWTRQMQLKRGDVVTLIPQQDGSISVYPEVKEEEPRQIILDTDEESEQSLRRRITGAYVDGFDIIQLRAENRFTDKQQDTIRKITEDLFGLEVVDAASNVVTIECLLKPTLPIEKTIHRINNIVKSMFDETVSALKEQDITLAKGVPRRIRDINRLSFVIYRALRSLILSPRLAERGEMSLIDSVDYLRVLHRITGTAYSIKNTS